MADSDVRNSVRAALQEFKLRTRGVLSPLPSIPPSHLAAPGPFSWPLLPQAETHSEAARLRGSLAPAALMLIDGSACSAADG